MRKFFNLVAAFVLCSTATLVVSCEDEISSVGSDLIDSGISAKVFYTDVIAYNTNNDSIRSDAKVLQNALVGVYDEPIFGRTKARFISQARLGKLNPDFGTEAEMDSVILTLPVYYKSGSDNVSIDTTYVYLQEGETPTDTATVRLKRTYKLDSIYGNTSIPITLQVREVAEYLYSQDSIYFSNRNLSNCSSCSNINDIEVYPTILGSLQITNEMTTFQEFKLNNSTTVSEPAVMVRISLDKNYFKQKFIDNAGSSNLSDQASFIRNFFRGIELSVPEDQGFLFTFNPSSENFKITLYHSMKNTAEGENQPERTQSSLVLNFNSYWSSTTGYNVQVNQFDHSNRSSQFVNAYTNPNTTEGDSRLYLGALEGSKTIIKLSQDQINEIQTNIQENGWAIVGAELNFYVDDSYGFRKAPYLFAWHSYTENGKLKEKNFDDIYKFYNSYPISVQFNPMYDYKNDSKLYTIRITDYIKSVVERGEVFENNQIVVSLGNFLLSPSSGYMNIMNTNYLYMNDRAFTSDRVVLHGNNTEQTDKKLRLKIYYTQK
ncbi:MAG: DUF4270 domain-containing protein [Weeksellaceae bacterium]|nr:DUF4270 domain-containing protein [Weeksellaceae bacterium]